jgi:predicted alpha/beta hydrolase family esterase
VNDWYEISKDFQKMRNHCKKFVSIFSTNDPFVRKENWSDAETEFGTKPILIKNKSHFDDKAGIKELPEALSAILEMSQTK